MVSGGPFLLLVVQARQLVLAFKIKFSTVHRVILLSAQHPHLGQILQDARSLLGRYTRIRFSNALMYFDTVVSYVGS